MAALESVLKSSGSTRSFLFWLSFQILSTFSLCSSFSGLQCWIPCTANKTEVSELLTCSLLVQSLFKALGMALTICPPDKKEDNSTTSHQSYCLFSMPTYLFTHLFLSGDNGEASETYSYETFFFTIIKSASYVNVISNGKVLGNVFLHQNS